MASPANGGVPDNANQHCPGTNDEQAGKAAACQGCPNQSVCASAPKNVVDPDLALINERMSRIKHKVLVLSGKGGVGKSTVSAQLAFALAAQGKEVGLLDIDICGPSIPKMLGLEGQEVHMSGSGWSPVYVEDNLAVMSIGFMLPNPDEAVIWRGPRKNGLIKQFLKDVVWGELDYLVVDAPPGTSDEHITIAQCLGTSVNDADGAVIVTTPQEVAIIDVRKEINFCKKVGLKVVGVVENMSGLQQRLPELRFMYPASSSTSQASHADGNSNGTGGSSTNGGLTDASSGAEQGAVGSQQQQQNSQAGHPQSQAVDVTQQVMSLLASHFPHLDQLMVHAQVFAPSRGGAQRMCEDMGVTLLGRVPMDPALTQAAESGLPVFEFESHKTAAAAGPSAQATSVSQANGSSSKVLPPVCIPALQQIVTKVVSALEGAGNGGASSNGVQGMEE